MHFWQRSKITVWEWQLFIKKRFAIEVLGKRIPYFKRYFQEHQWSAFSFMAKNHSDSVVFENANFGEIKDQSLRTAPIQKKTFEGEVLGMCLPYVKMYSQENQWSAFSFMTQITQIRLFSWMPLLEKSKIILLRTSPFQKKIRLQLLDMCLTYVKRYF